MLADFIPLLFALLLIVLGYFFGSYREKKHFESLRKREAASLHKPVVTFDESDDEFPSDSDITRVALVSGSVVVSVDYFKRFLASLRNIFGGRVNSYETLIDRARREALLRMKEKASGAARISNMRLETSTLSSGQGLGSIEVHAYGTAIFTDNPVLAKGQFNAPTRVDSTPPKFV